MTRLTVLFSVVMLIFALSANAAQAPQAKQAAQAKPAAQTKPSASTSAPVTQAKPPATVKPFSTSTKLMEGLLSIEGEIDIRAQLTREHSNESRKLFESNVEKMATWIVDELFKEREFDAKDKGAANPAAPKQDSKIPKVDKNYTPVEPLAPPDPAKGTTQKEFVADKGIPLWIDTTPKLLSLKSEIEQSDKNIAASFRNAADLVANASPEIRARSMIDYMSWRLIGILGDFRPEPPGVNEDGNCQDDPVIERYIVNYLNAVVKKEYSKALALLLTFHNFTICASMRQMVTLDIVLRDVLGNAVGLYGDIIKGKRGSALDEYMGKFDSYKPKVIAAGKPAVSDEAQDLLYGATFNIAYTFLDTIKFVSPSWQAWMCDNAAILQRAFQSGPAYDMGIIYYDAESNGSYDLPILPADTRKPISCKSVPKSLMSETHSVFGIPFSMMNDYCMQMENLSPAKSPMPFNDAFSNTVSTGKLAYGEGGLFNATRGMPLAGGNACGGGGDGGGDATIACKGPSGMNLGQCSQGYIPAIQGGKGTQSTGGAHGGLGEKAPNFQTWENMNKAALCGSWAGGEPIEDVKPIPLDSPFSSTPYNTVQDLQDAAAAGSSSAQEELDAREDEVEDLTSEVSNGKANANIQKAKKALSGGIKIVGDSSQMNADGAFKAGALNGAAGEGAIACYDGETGNIYLSAAFFKQDKETQKNILMHEAIHAAMEDSEADHVVTAAMGLGGGQDATGGGMYGDGMPKPDDLSSCTAQLYHGLLSGQQCSSTGPKTAGKPPQPDPGGGDPDNPYAAGTGGGQYSSQGGMNKMGGDGDGGGGLDDSPCGGPGKPCVGGAKGMNNPCEPAGGGSPMLLCTQDDCYPTQMYKDKKSLLTNDPAMQKMPVSVKKMLGL